MGDFDTLAYAASGMDAQRAALDISAKNLALAQTATPTHRVFRSVPTFSAAPTSSPDTFARFVDLYDTDDGSIPAERAGDAEDDIGGFAEDAVPEVVSVTGSREQTGADVDTVTEMVSMLDAQRAYETNASMFDLGKQMIEKTIAVAGQ